MNDKTNVEIKGMSNSLTDSRFGKWGWSMVVYSFILFFFYGGLTTDGMNLLPDMFAATYGWDSNTLLAYATPASLIGILGNLIFGQIIMKSGPRVVASVGLIVSGVAYALFGLSPSPMMYAVTLGVVCFFAAGYGLIAPATLMSNWFPRKKGIALGWASMGAPICTALFIPLLSLLFTSLGIIFSFAVVGIVVVIIGIATLFWVKDYPEQVGVLPDNMPTDDNYQSSQEVAQNYKSPFTIKKLLTDKDMWCISLGFGMLWMVTVGIVSQFVPRMISVGMDQSGALMMLTVAALIACPGSYFWGWLDQKAGTRKATLVYAFCYIVALILLIFEFGGIVIWIASIFVGLGIGGLLNLLPSLVIAVYGRYDFTAANRLVTTIASIVRVFAFAIMAALLQLSGGSYALPYGVFIAIDIVGIILIFCVTDKCKGKTD